MRLFFASALILSGLASAACPAGAQSLEAAASNDGGSFSIPLGGDLHQHLLFLSPARPRGTVIMLPGGAGDVGVERDGDVLHGDNFLVRTRSLWAARGYAVVIPDTIDNANLRGARSSAAYAQIIGLIVMFAKSRAAGPVFLIGTSQGSIAAMNGAAHLQPGSIAGVVLTESVSVMGGSHETVFDADPEAVRVPALIVANRADQCRVAPPSDAPRIAASMKHAKNVQVIYVNGDQTKSDNSCASLTPHGYFGIEQQVVGFDHIVDAIARAGLTWSPCVRLSRMLPLPRDAQGLSYVLLCWIVQTGFARR